MEYTRTVRFSARCAACFF